MTDREIVLRKIRALLQKTVANGCPVEEALAAHAKAQALIDEHQVSHEELYGTGPGGRWREPQPEPEPEPAEPKQQQQAEPESERAAEARARRPREFWTVVGIVALLVVGGVAWLILDRQHQEALRKQEYEQQRQAEEREAAQRRSAQRQAEEREAAQRQAAITAQREAAQRLMSAMPFDGEAEQRVAARRAAYISGRDLEFSDLTEPPASETAYRLHGTITNHSRQTLRTMVMEVTLFDCPSGTSAPRYLTPRVPPGCRIVGQDSKRDDLNIPPGQARTFGTGIFYVFHNVPPSDPQRPRLVRWGIVFASACTWFPQSATAGVPWCENKTSAE
jgi:hypothetical protein